MLEPIYKKKFKQDVERLKKRGKILKKFQAILSILINRGTLLPNHRDHQLRGEYSDCRECHIEPDWLLIYFIGDGAITFVRTGTHADLFG